MFYVFRILQKSTSAAIRAELDRKYKAQQDVIANAISQAQLANQTAKTQYDIRAPYFKPETTSDIDTVLSSLGGAGASTGQWKSSKGQIWTDTNKTPVGTFTGKDGKTYTRYSDGSSGSTIWSYQ